MVSDPAVADDAARTDLPLDGIVVADFSRVLAGPLATMLMADLGATVVKVEHPARGDDTRHWGPPWAESGSSYFESVNRSKRSVGLDLADPADLALAQELARRADVLVENFRVGALDKFGLGYDDVRRTNPGLVYCSISGYGSGAGAVLPGYDFVAQAVGGLMSITGQAEGEPTKAGVALVDVLTAKDATIGILAALRARDRSGRGQQVEVNLLSTTLAAMVNQASGFLATGTPPGRMGNRHPSIAPYETLHCRDGLIAIACGNDGQFARLTEVLGIPAAAADPRFRTNADRVANREALVAALEERLCAEDAGEWENRLVAAGVPAGLVAGFDEAFARAERLGLEPTVPVGDGHPAQVSHPIRYSGMTPRRPTAPPRLAEHDHEVRAWLARPGADRTTLA